MEPILLYHRPADECVEYLLGNPLYADKMDFIPVKHFDAKGDRIFDETISGCQAWEKARMVVVTVRSGITIPAPLHRW